MRPTWSTICWSSAVASAPRSSGAMAWRSSSLRVFASLPFFKKEGKKETLALHFSVLESLWEMGLGGKWKLVRRGGGKARSLGVDGVEDWVVARVRVEGVWEDKAMAMDMVFSVHRAPVACVPLVCLVSIMLHTLESLPILL